MTDRSDDAIRSDLAKLQKPATGYHDVRIALDQARLARERLAADVAPLLARAVAAEARAEKAEGTEDQMLTHLTLMTARVVRLSRRAAAVEAALAELSDVRVYGERNSTYYCGAQTMAKRVRAALAAAAPPREDELPDDWYVRVGHYEDDVPFAYCSARGPHRAHCILPEKHSAEHEWAWFTREDRALAEAAR